jgi:hypothetical protein
MRAFVLNLDADGELAHPTGYAPKASLRARAKELAQRIEGLVPAGDIVVDDRAPTGVARGRQGIAWCPTPRALAILRHAGATPAPSPPFDVVRQVNHRAFVAPLGGGLPGGTFLRSRSELDERVAGGAWMLKRPWGFSGTGQRRVANGALDESDARWIDASLRAGGLWVEPWVAIAAEFCMHGFVARDGEAVLGVACVQRCSARGQWQATQRDEGELGAAQRAALKAATERSAEALAAARYFGPFGVDAFRYHDGREERFQPLSEVNARYTMGWAIGMGERRPDLAF